MALATVELERRLPFAPEDLCALVADVRSYPSFIPWVQRLDIVSERQEGETWIGVARAQIGWRALREHFTTEVRVTENAIDVKLVSGPFKSLANRWRFSDAAHGAAIKFYVAYEFKNPNPASRRYDQPRTRREPDHRRVRNRSEAAVWRNELDRVAEVSEPIWRTRADRQRTAGALPARRSGPRVAWACSVSD